MCLPPDHALAGCSSIKLELLNGYNCLLKSDIGFWSDLCHKTMPASRFLVQTDEFAFRELARSSTLPYFVTNLASDADFVKGRTVIPVSDAEANVSFYMIFRRENQDYQRIAQQLARSHSL